MNNSIWLSGGSGSLTSGDMSFDKSTRIDHKRGHQWFVGNSEQELYSKKKQAVESICKIQSSAPTASTDSFMHGGVSPWSGSQRGDDDPYGSKSIGVPIVSDKNDSPDVPAFVNMEKMGSEDRFKNDSLISLSMSQAAEDPQFRNTALRKVKVNEVTVPQNSSPQLVGSSIFFPVDRNNNVISSNFLRSATITCVLGLLTNSPLGSTSSKTNGKFVPNSHYYSGIGNNMLSVGLTSELGSYGNSLGRYGKESANFMSTDPFYSKAQDNFLTLDPFFGQATETFVPTGFGQDGDDDVVIHCSNETLDLPSMVENSDVLPNHQSIDLICSYDVLPNHQSIDLICSYDVLPNSQSTAFAQPIEASGEKDAEVQLNGNVNLGASSKGDRAKKKNEAKVKKESSSNFPSNVKSLLSTGIFDGVPVKYVSWTREKSLRGVVKGTGYLCSCEECNFSKAVNAYEFERHAGGKTKHPNNHIYFENGRTIYAVVLELKATPQKMLFEKIQNATGSGINQKNFTTWKASYQAATRELQRIYGNDEVVVPS